MLLLLLQHNVPYFPEFWYSFPPILWLPTDFLWRPSPVPVRTEPGLHDRARKQCCILPEMLLPPLQYCSDPVASHHIHTGHHKCGKGCCFVLLRSSSLADRHRLVHNFPPSVLPGLDCSVSRLSGCVAQAAVLAVILPVNSLLLVHNLLT